MSFVQEEHTKEIVVVKCIYFAVVIPASVVSFIYIAYQEEQLHVNPN